MRCARCGTENEPGARFCSSCGTALIAGEETPATDAPQPDRREETVPAPDAAPAAATPGPPAPPPPTPRRRVVEVARSGWARAAAWGVGAFLVLVALGELLAVLQTQTEPFGGGIAGPPPGFDFSAGDVFLSGLLTTYQFLHVSIEFDFPLGALAPDAPAFDFSASFAVALMLGTALAAWLLFLGGRSVARLADGPAWARPIHGAKVAIPFVLLAFAVTFAARFAIDFAELGAPLPAGTEFVAQPSPLSVLVWPLLIALVAGAAGGAWTARDELFRGDLPGRVRGALAGGWRMMWTTLALSFVGLLVLAAVHPDETAGYFRIVGELGAAGGTYFALSTLLLLPNMSAWVAAGSVGGPAISVGLFGNSCALVSYLSFPAGAADAPTDLGPEVFLTNPCAAIESGVHFDAAPAGYFLFLFVPILAGLLGGWHAARRARARTAAEGAQAGAGAGVIFGIIFLFVLLLSRITVGFSGFFGLFEGGSFSLGPGVLPAFGLALVWGVVIGALSGVVAARRGAAAPAATPPDEPPAQA